MTPKQKAEDIFSKMLNAGDLTRYAAKNCALISVDDMQLVMTSLWKVAGIDEQHRSTYLEEVKQEIKNIKL